jgi:hypothetical protein
MAKTGWTDSWLNTPHDGTPLSLHAQRSSLQRRGGKAFQSDHRESALHEFDVRFLSSASYSEPALSSG